MIYHSPFIFSDVPRAWAFWYATNFGFSHIIGNCRIMTNSKNICLLENKINNFTDIYSKRLKGVQIENNEATELIEKHDTEETFHYIDPPYVGAQQGHYGGYEQEHFNLLLDILSKIKGKFLLSSYPNEELTKYVKLFGWKQKEIFLHLNSSSTKGKKRQEILTFNYEI